jgi:tetratricopeptide (TPR) repeat protein
MIRLSIIKAPLLLILFAAVIYMAGCSYATHQTISKDNTDEEDPEPVYETSLDDDYQDFVSYMYMGNRSNNFSTFFNVYYTAKEDFELAMEEYRTTTLAAYNKRLDSLNINASLSSGGKEQLNNVIKGASKVIQYRKNSRFIDDAVLLIGKSYYYLNDFLQAERKFNEFLSKLSSSELIDEARLFLGKTKLKLGQVKDAETILKKLVINSTDNSIKSEAAQDLAIYAVSKKDYETAIKYFEESVKFAPDSDKKAEKQYILAKIYSINKPLQAASQYKKAMDLSSDFDLSYYSKLNFAKSLIVIKDYRQAGEMLEELDLKYREYPDYKHLVELEIANNYYAQGKYKNALNKYYEVIVEYPGTVSAADAYYYLASYYEKEQNDYLNALVNYNKVGQESMYSDFALESSTKSNTLDRYFVLEATINNTEKRQIPEENVGVENFRRIFNDDRGIENNNREGENTIPGQDEGTGKGMKGRGYPPVDSLEQEETGEQTDEQTGKQTGDQTPKELNMKDPVISQDTLDKTAGDSLFIDTTTSTVTSDPRYDAYFEMAELFYYKLGRVDSAEYYLQKILTLYDESDKISKVMYALANIYKNAGNTTKANEYFEKVIAEYPGSIFANESRKVLGRQIVEAEHDPSEDLYIEASGDVFNKRYDEAAAKLTKLINEYPSSSFIPNSLYSLGWIYENVYGKNDSAIVYYSRLKDGYPQTEFYAQVSGKLDVINAPEETPEETSKETEKNQEEKPEEELNPEENKEEIPQEILDEIKDQNEKNNKETEENDPKRRP